MTTFDQWIIFSAELDVQGIVRVGQCVTGSFLKATLLIWPQVKKAGPE